MSEGWLSAPRGRLVRIVGRWVSMLLFFTAGVFFLWSAFDPLRPWRLLVGLALSVLCLLQFWVLMRTRPRF